MSSGDEGLSSSSSSSRQANEREDLSKEHSLDELAKGLASGTITRGQVLKFGGAALLGGALSASFPGVALARPRLNNRGKPKHPPGIFDPGYDPTGDESFPITSLPPTDVPTSARIPPSLLPPVGMQGTQQQLGYPGSCPAWATTYGLATFAAAKAGNYSPDQPSLQASPAYIYIGVCLQNNMAQYDCKGSNMLPYFNILAQGGTPNWQQAPYPPPPAICRQLWDDYKSQNLQPDSRFSFPISSVVRISTALDQVKQKIADGNALAYGTHLYTDFESYNGSPVPYVGNGQLQINPITQKLAGHCMLIIGYDDEVGSGAVLIQNSFGTEWGNQGFIWMAYDTFTTLSEGSAWYFEV